MTDDRIPPGALAYLDEFRAWAIGDDFDREEAVAHADKSELQRLVDAYDALSEEVWDWLDNPRAPEDTPQEYYDVTDITKAAESAKGILEPPTAEDQARMKSNIEEYLELLRKRQGQPPDQW